MGFDVYVTITYYIHLSICFNDDLKLPATVIMLCFSCVLGFILVFILFLCVLLVITLLSQNVNKQDCQCCILQCSTDLTKAFFTFQRTYSSMVHA